MFKIFVLSLLIALSFGSKSSRNDCWWTGCQLDSWAVKGCEQYDMVERDRAPCQGGWLYYCCPRGGGGGDDAPISNLSFQQFSQGVTAHGYPAPNNQQFDVFKNNACSKGGICSMRDAAMSLVHLLHESDGLRARREYACEVTGCPGHYETPGCDIPGQRYYGRGYIQLTWCYNYRPASLYLFGDDRLVYDPDMVARDDNLVWDTAFWYWRFNVRDRPNVSQGWFGASTRAINGGLECDGEFQHIARKRFEMYGRVRQAFGLDGPGDERGCYN